MGNQPYIVGVGAANLDLNGASCAPIHLRDSNPGHISLSAGGVTRNVCENLARLGADVKLLSCVGDDVFGSYIRRSCVEAGIDIRYLHEAKGAHSSIYLSILDADGDMLVGMSDMRIVQQDLPADYLPSQKQLIQGAKVVTCDPCMGKRRCCSCWTCASRRRSCASTRSPARMRASSRRSSAGSTRPSPTAWSWRSWPGWRSVPAPICSARAKWF